jgi:hypothetical protein
VKVVKGYQVIKLATPVNAEQYTFVSYQQSASDGQIAQYSVKSDNSNVNYYANVDMVWVDAANKWTNLVSAESEGKNEYLCSHIRLITSPFTTSINEALNFTTKYLAPGLYNFTALAVETGQSDSVQINVTLRKTFFYIK